TCLTSLAVTSTLFIGLVFLFLHPLGRAAGVPAHPEYIGMTAVIIGMDAFCSVPFAYLRYQKKALRFAALKLLFIGLNIGLNLFFLLVCPWLWEHFPDNMSWLYRPDYGVGYILVSNLISTFIVSLALSPEIFRIRWQFNRTLWKRILRYSFPLLILGVAGIMNQTIDKILYPVLVTDPAVAMEELGIYGANYKIAIVMVMFIQAFRYAYEPFIFAQHKDEDKRGAYTVAMKYFIIFGLLIFLGVMFYIDILRYFVNPRYFAGLKVVPVVMLAELFFGIFFNLSLWYKLTDRTQWGAYFSMCGLVVTVAINVIFVPRYGYVACAWAAFVCYAAMMLASWAFGQRYYPIRYDLKTIGRYCLLAALLYAVAEWVPIESTVLRLGFRTVLLLVYVVYLLKNDLPLREIPYVNRLFKR
ncbi:MAG: polysaccharide biosynthesis C-terminal domain-containing protein, partial [Odoribacter sp.]|nr:polysaccharide biosynthesis C-terminal domain-containing protein [Odoribacter sp.]